MGTVSVIGCHPGVCQSGGMNDILIVNSLIMELAIMVTVNAAKIPGLVDHVSQVNMGDNRGLRGSTEVSTAYRL